MIATKEILSIDLGKFNSIFCWFDQELKKAEYRTIPSSPDQVRQAQLRKSGQTVVMEACSQAGWVSDLCHELGLQVTVASTTGATLQWKHVKRKTDRDDTLKLAQLAAVGEIQAVSIPPKEVRQRKSLFGLRKRLVGERIRSQNRIRGLLVRC